MSKQTRSDLRVARHERLRKRISGVATKPRLAVFRSLKHISAQLIDDTTGTTLAYASSVEKAIGSGNADGAKKVGQLLAERAKKAGVSEVVFDRGGFRFHGRVSALAQGARDGGLKF
jgi:large subunit ribosomal protein L18